MFIDSHDRELLKRMSCASDSQLEAALREDARQMINRAHWMTGERPFTRSTQDTINRLLQQAQDIQRWLFPVIA